jgi:hypothetical protein
LIQIIQLAGSIYGPADSLRLAHGGVDPAGRARFRFFVTDPTPVQEFCLLQEPRLLLAGAPRGPLGVAGR